MILKSFTVQGFKNLTEAVTLGPLQHVNLLHGANNAGKTNVLQAMDAAFRLLRVGNQVTKEQVASLEAAAKPAGYAFAEMQNRRSPSTIRFQIEFSLPTAELEEAGIEARYATEHVAIGLELSPGIGSAQLKVVHFVIGDIDVALKDPTRDGPIVGFAQTIRAHIARTYALDSEKMGSPFALLDVGTGGGEGGLVPQPLRDALFDARQSLDHDERRRWNLFIRLARELEPELGTGQFDTAFDRASGRANLIYDNGQEAMPVDTLGSGVQKFVALLASLVLSRAALIGLEEPELHLSYSLQQRFRRVLQCISEDGGPQQFFLTSHSSALDEADNSFVLELRDNAPVIERRAWIDSAAPPPPAPAPPPPPRIEETVVTRAPDVVAPPPADTAKPAEDVPAPPDLDSLIGLVDQLAELDPGQIVAAKEAATRGKPEPAAAAGSAPNKSPAAAGGGNGQRVVDAAPWRLPKK